jgi:hypothetical protein
LGIPDLGIGGWVLGIKFVSQSGNHHSPRFTIAFRSA